MARHKNTDWDLPKESNNTYRDGVVTNALLMDIRDELRALNKTFNCPNFRRIPFVLDKIARQPRRKPSVLARFWKRIRLWLTW